MNNETFSRGIVSQIAGLQTQRLLQERRWLDQMKTWDHGMPPPTRWVRIKRRARYHLTRARVALARWIAGSEWPEDY